MNKYKFPYNLRKRAEASSKKRLAGIEALFTKNESMEKGIEQQGLKMNIEIEKALKTALKTDDWTICKEIVEIEKKLKKAITVNKEKILEYIKDLTLFRYIINEKLKT